MKILAVSDQVDDRLYHAQVRERFPDIDLLVGCGDLPYEYLEFLVTAMNVPLVYVPGNHDPVYKADDPLSQAEGGLCLDQRVTRIKGLLMAGIGGSIRYRPDGVNQYTQSEMYYRLRKLVPGLFWQRLMGHHPLDLFIAHSPPLGIHDDDDLAHTGFQALRDFINTLKPRYFLHGHTMYYKANLEPPMTQVGDTRVINVYPYRVIEVD